MFSRQVISAVMTAIMLACPFLDNGECCGKCPSHHAAVKAENIDEHQAAHVDHSCCDHDHSSLLLNEAEGSDEPCNHKCPHSVSENDCLCHGAVLPSHVRCPDHDLDSTWLDIDVSDIGGFASSMLCVAQLTPHQPISHFPPLLSGWQMRVQVSSYLL